MEGQEITHIHHNIAQKYRIVLERSAVKNIDGFKVECNSDSMLELFNDALKLYEWAKRETKTTVTIESKGE